MHALMCEREMLHHCARKFDIRTAFRPDTQSNTHGTWHGSRLLFPDHLFGEKRPATATRSHRRGAEPLWVALGQTCDYFLTPLRRTCIAVTRTAYAHAHGMRIIGTEQHGSNVVTVIDIVVHV